MNKQELYKKLDKEQYKLKNNVPFYQPFAVVLNKVRQWVKELKLDEPSMEECDYFTAPYNYGESTDIDYNICNICRYHEKCNDKVKSNFDVWNYCPNCGGKIKKEIKNGKA